MRLDLLVSTFLALALLGLSGCANDAAAWAAGDPKADYKARANPRFRQGYVQARSDTVKEQYWRQQDLERLPDGGRSDQGGRQVYYTLPGPAETSDGVRLHPSEITVPVVE